MRGRGLALAKCETARARLRDGWRERRRNSRQSSRMIHAPDHRNTDSLQARRELVARGRGVASVASRGGAGAGEPP